MTETALPRELESTAVVRFQDCDPFGHLNNARYIDYFMDARTEQLIDAYDFDLFTVGESLGCSWVVSKSQIAFLLPAGIREKVLIRTRLLEATGRKLLLEGVMLDAHGTRLKSVAWVTFTFINLANGRPATHPQELMQLFNSVQVDDSYKADGFDERVGQLRATHRQMRRVQAVAGA